MSGVEAIAAILGIAGAGISVSAALYDVASTAAGAKEDMRTIAESIDTYSSVLETLGRQLEASQAICSAEGLRLAVDLQRQSEALFQKISEHLPSKSTPSLGQKMAWFFNRERVKFLLGQIDQLKATVSLLVQILILAQTSQPASVTKNVNVNVHVVNAEITSQFRRAENRILQYQNASVKRSKLQIESESREIQDALPWEEDSEVLEVVQQQHDEEPEEARFAALSLRTSEMSMDVAHANSAQLVNMLLDHWTVMEPHMAASESNTTASGEEQGTSEVNSLRQSATQGSNVTPVMSTPSRVEEQSSSSGGIKGWWQNYRQGQRTKKQLETQEKELSRREAQLERERSFVERELKLQEAEKENAAAAAKALSERQQNLITSQTLQEERDRQKQRELEMRMQENVRRTNTKKDLASHRAAVREQLKAARKYSSRPPQQPISGVSSNASLPSRRPSAANSHTSTEHTTRDQQESPPPPYGFTSARSMSSELGSTVSFDNAASLDDPDLGRDAKLNTLLPDTLLKGKAARKQVRQELRNARRAAKARAK